MFRVELTPDESAYVQHLIDNFAAVIGDNWDEELPYVRRYRAIPLYVGWFESTALTRDGDVVYWNTVEGYWWGVRTVEDKILLRFSLMEGAKRYPKIKSLTPLRPLNAVTCDECNGTGIMPIPELSYFMCKCGGVGWLDS